MRGSGISGRGFWRHFFARRLLLAALMLTGITFISFAMMRLAGSDAITELYADKGAVDQAIIDARRQQLGLDRPFLQQYLTWAAGLLRGDMGVSYVSGNDVLTTFISKLPATGMLTAMAAGATVLISVPLGTLAAVRHDKSVDYLLRFLSFLGHSMPNFFTALLLMQLFSIKLKLLPVISNGITIQGAALPALTLTIAMSSKYIRQVRTAVLEELTKEYVDGARSRGIPMRTILKGSVLRAAMPTIVTMLAMSIGSLLGGTAVVESIFMWDGIGKLAVDAIVMRDYPIVQAYVIWMAVIYMTVNFITEILSYALDPEMRAGVKGR